MNRRPPLLVIVPLLLVAACSQPPAPLPPPTLSVDPTLRPAVDALPAFDDGEPRPVASVTGEDGSQADFVANEVWLSSDREADVQALVARWNGRILQSVRPADFGIAELPSQYLIRIDAAAADTDRLGADLRALDARSSGDYRISSQAGLELLAASAHEAAQGVKLGLNWVGSGAGFRERESFEAPSGAKLAGVTYSANAFGWPSHSAGSPQDIGVVEAWRALDLAGKLGNRVKLAVLDMGFEPDLDWSSPYKALSNVPLNDAIGTRNLLSCSGGNSCPYHGTNVVSAAMALAGNGYGGAGPAGPVAEPVVVFTLYDFFTSMTALLQARAAGARIMNMSYSAPVPWYLEWSVLPFEATTAALRSSGTLIFAAAGNDGKDVDATGCTLGVCFERTWVTPCENAGVICVGGLRGNSKMRADGSNYGNEHVDLFAPYTLWLGPDPDAPDNSARALSGTSFSSPFAAGVAALVWAADPGLSADGVERALMDTAHSSPDPNVRRYVNARAAVVSVLGNVPPSLTLGAAGGAVPYGVELTLTADVFDFEDPFPCCTLQWTSDVDGPLGTGRSVAHTFSELGARKITVTATDSGGATATATLAFEVVNDPPVATLSQPTGGSTVFRTAPVVLRGSATDRNEIVGVLACEGLTWTSSLPEDPFPVSGCEVEVRFPSNGSRTLTLTARDGLGASDTETVVVTVVDPPDDSPPNVRVTSPQDRAPVGTDDVLTLSGTATDPEGTAPLAYVWTVRLGENPPIVVGNEPSVTWKPSDTYDFSSEGTYTIQVRLNVSDPQGNTGTDFITLEFLILR